MLTIDILFKLVITVLLRDLREYYSIYVANAFTMNLENLRCEHFLVLIV